MGESRIFALRRSDNCAECGSALAAGTRADWNAAQKKVMCLRCIDRRGEDDDGRSPEPIELQRGTPGASARRRYGKLHAQREEAAKKKLGRRLGGVCLALSNEPQSTLAWGVGSKGERLLGEFLESLHDGERIVVLHDRRILGSRANIDHIVICRSGVYVIDAKNYTGKVQRIDKGGWFSTDLRLYVGRRDCTNLVGGMAKQIAAVRAVLAETRVPEVEVPLKPTLCFVEGEWSLFAKPFVLNGVWVGWPKALRERLLADGPLTSDDLMRVTQVLADALPPG